jgi:hypothetical protein
MGKVINLNKYLAIQIEMYAEYMQAIKECRPMSVLRYYR